MLAEDTCDVRMLFPFRVVADNSPFTFVLIPCVSTNNTTLFNASVPTVNTLPFPLRDTPESLAVIAVKDIFFSN